MNKLIILCVLFLSTVAFGQRSYVSSLQKVTFRTGPGTDNKIIRMIMSDEKINIVEAGEVWTKITDKSGTEGFVLNRFISKETPSSVKYTWLKSKFDKLEVKNKKMSTILKDMKVELKSSQSSLVNSEASLKEVNGSYEELKVGSAEFLTLKKKYDQAIYKLKLKTDKVKDLESTVNTHYIKWFLAGGGVLLLGWLIGLISRKKKGYNSGISF
jgi:SH3 domain protein